MISPLAYIHPEAKIGENCEIGPFVYIDKNVEIGDNCQIMPHASVLYGTRMGNNNKIFHGAVIGGVPQDLKFKGEDTTCEIGDNNLIRENVTINRGTASRGKTVVGSNNLLMENSQLNQNCRRGINRRQRNIKRLRSYSPILPHRWLHYGTRRQPYQYGCPALHNNRKRTGTLLRIEYRRSAP